MKNKNNLILNSQGFTLIEIMITITLVMIFFSASVYYLGNFYIAAQLNKTTDTLSTQLNLSRIRAQAGKNDSRHGMYIDNLNKAFTLFEGNSYLTRVPENDITTEYSPAISIIGLNEIIFDINSGHPSSYGMLSITSPNYPRDFFITITPLGTNYIN